MQRWEESSSCSLPTNRSGREFMQKSMDIPHQHPVVDVAHDCPGLFVANNHIWARREGWNAGSTKWKRGRYWRESGLAPSSFPLANLDLLISEYRLFLFTVPVSHAPKVPVVTERPLPGTQPSPLDTAEYSLYAGRRTHLLYPGWILFCITLPRAIQYRYRCSGWIDRQC